MYVYFFFWKKTKLLEIVVVFLCFYISLYWSDLFRGRCVTVFMDVNFTVLRTHYKYSTYCEFCWYKIKFAAYLHVLVHLVIIKIKWSSCPWKKNWCHLDKESDRSFFAILRTALEKIMNYIKYTRISILSICKWILEKSGCGLGYLNLIQDVFPWILKYFCLIFHY